MSLSFAATSDYQGQSGTGGKRRGKEGDFSVGVVNRGSRRPPLERAGGVGGFSTSVVSSPSYRSTYRSPAEILYPTEGPVLSPYTSLSASPVRRIRGLATLNLRRPEYNAVHNNGQ